jgi:hypothetical protein
VFCRKSGYQWVENKGLEYRPIETFLDLTPLLDMSAAFNTKKGETRMCRGRQKHEHGAYHPTRFAPYPPRGQQPQNCHPVAASGQKRVSTQNADAQIWKINALYSELTAVYREGVAPGERLSADQADKRAHMVPYLNLMSHVRERAEYWKLLPAEKSDPMHWNIGGCAEVSWVRQHIAEQLEVLRKTPGSVLPDLTALEIPKPYMTADNGTKAHNPMHPCKSCQNLFSDSDRDHSLLLIRREYLERGSMDQAVTDTVADSNAVQNLTDKGYTRDEHGRWS